MVLKDLYEKKVVKMKLDDFIEEHEKLIKILRKGDKKELMAEADSQEKELNEYK
jgi:fructose-specific phosphotransferase system component IIB